MATQHKYQLPKIPENEFFNTYMSDQEPEYLDMGYYNEDNDEFQRQAYETLKSQVQDSMLREFNQSRLSQPDTNKNELVSMKSLLNKEINEVKQYQNRMD